MSVPKTEIIGERVTIRKTTKDDLPDVMTLWNDGWVMNYINVAT
ncbi:MAG: hypothetical protein ACYTF1_07325 [Planctomycetota bacterium]|jgi:hypothetical protein